MKTKVMHQWQYKVYGTRTIVVHPRENLEAEVIAIVAHMKETLEPEAHMSKLEYMGPITVEVTNG